MIRYEPSDLSEFIGRLGSTEPVEAADDRELFAEVEAIHSNLLAAHTYIIQLVGQYHYLVWKYQYILMGKGIGMLDDERQEYARIINLLRCRRNKYWDYFGRPTDQVTRTFVGIPW